MEPPSKAGPTDEDVTLRPVDRDTWTDVAGLRVTEAQRDFVAEPAYYLALCCYGSAGWRPLAVLVRGRVVGFVMWAVDPDDGSCWLGGLLIDREQQGKGYGKRAVRAAVAMLAESDAHRDFALSYKPENVVARRLYAGLRFIETGERDGDEVVARRTLDEPG